MLTLSRLVHKAQMQVGYVHGNYAVKPSDETELHLALLRDEVLGPGRIPDDLDVGVANSGNPKETALGILGNGRPHATTWRSESHVDMNEVAVLTNLVDVHTVNEAEIHDIDRDFGVENVSELLPEGVLVRWPIVRRLFRSFIQGIRWFAKRFGKLAGNTEHTVAGHNSEITAETVRYGDLSPGGQGAFVTIRYEGGLHVLYQRGFLMLLHGLEK